jgi:hypothetical protein
VTARNPAGKASSNRGGYTPAGHWCIEAILKGIWQLNGTSELGDGFSNRLLQLDLPGGLIDFCRSTIIWRKKIDRRRSVRIVVVIVRRTRRKSDIHGKPSL